MGIENGDKQYVTELFARARKAQAVADNYSQRRVDELAAAIVYALSREKTALEIAQMALKRPAWEISNPSTQNGQKNAGGLLQC